LVSFFVFLSILLLHSFGSFGPPSVLDIVRMMVLHPDGYQKLVENEEKYLKLICGRIITFLREGNLKISIYALLYVFLHF
jgi:hypothetical protein